MARFNLKNITKNLQKSADDLKKTVSDVAETLPDTVKNMNVGDSAKDAAHKGKSTLGNLISMGGAALADQLDKTIKTEAPRLAAGSFVLVGLTKMCNNAIVQYGAAEWRGEVSACAGNQPA